MEPHRGHSGVVPEAMQFPQSKCLHRNEWLTSEMDRKTVQPAHCMPECPPDHGLAMIREDQRPAANQFENSYDKYNWDGKTMKFFVLFIVKKGKRKPVQNIVQLKKLFNQL